MTRRLRGTTFFSMLGVLVLGLASAASAQTPSSSPTDSATQGTPSAQVPMSGSGQPSPSMLVTGRPLQGRVELGIYRAAGYTGFVVGGGVGARPLRDPNLEIAGDFSLLRSGGINGFYTSGNVLYNIPLTRSKLVPFAGGGLAILHGNSTSARPQLQAGVEGPLNDRVRARGDLRIVFTSGAITTFILGGVSF